MIVKFTLLTKKGYLKQSIRGTCAPTILDNATLYSSLAQAEFHKTKAARMYKDIQIKKIIEKIEVK